MHNQSTDAQWDISELLNMKKLSAFLLFLCFILDSYAEFPNISASHPTTIDVVNAYLFNEYGPSKFKNTVPLFRPLQASSNHLQISIYRAEQYYGNYLKATEFPETTFEVRYNKYGYLSEIIDGEKHYYFIYDSYSGEMKNYKCYNTMTGTLLEEETISSLLADVRFFYYNGQSWLIHNLDLTFTYDRTPFLEVRYKDGISNRGTEYYAFRENKKGERMVVFKGSIWIGKKDLKTIAPYWKDYSANRYWDRILKHDFDKAYYHYTKTYFNEVGLHEKYGISLQECLSHGVRDNKYYEYTWLPY